MCSCNVAPIVTRYEEEGYQIEQCPECGEFDPEALDLTAAEEAALELITYQKIVAAIQRLEDEADAELESLIFDDEHDFDSAVKAAGY